MFEEYCPAHQSRVLLSTSRIEALRNTPAGVVVAWRCWCGHRGESVRQQGRQDPQVPHTPPPELRQAC